MTRVLTAIFCLILSALPAWALAWASPSGTGLAQRGASIGGPGSDGVWDRRYYYLTDSLFSVIGLIEPGLDEPRVVERLNYTPYGEPTLCFGFDLNLSGGTALADGGLAGGEGEGGELEDLEGFAGELEAAAGVVALWTQGQRLDA